MTESRRDAPTLLWHTRQEDLDGIRCSMYVAEKLDLRLPRIKDLCDYFEHRIDYTKHKLSQTVIHDIQKWQAARRDR